MQMESTTGCLKAWLGYASTEGEQDIKREVCLSLEGPFGEAKRAVKHCLLEGEQTVLRESVKRLEGPLEDKSIILEKKI